MSEVEARPAPTRGRSSTRGGRGGPSRGGYRGSRKPANGTPAHVSDTQQTDDVLEDDGELGEMKKMYGAQLGMLKDMFPDWTDVDLVFALQESDGDVSATVDKITQGNVSQFSEVKKVKDRARSKVKEDSATASATDKATTRAGRGRGSIEGARGGRGRGSDRGRGGFRGGRGGHATINGTPKDAAAVSVPTTESPAWDTTTATNAPNGDVDTAVADANQDAAAEGAKSSWGNVVTAETTPAAASEGMKRSLIPEGGPKKSWASMFAQPKPLPPKQATVSPQPPPAELVASGEISAPTVDQATEPAEAESGPPAPATQDSVTDDVPEPSPLAPPESNEEEELVPPSNIPLTEENVEHLPDSSHAPATQTTASTIGSVDTRNATPTSGNQQAPIGSRPPMGGYAATAYRATSAAGRSASFQRRVLEQQEAVVMPGHNALDRAAVQFGSMGLNGEPGPDVDEDREEPETQKILQHSPPAQPKTSLPPAPRQTSETARPEGLPTPKQAPGLPPASQQNQQQMQEAAVAPGLSQDQSQMNPTYNQYGRYGQPMQQDTSAQQQKPYDPFSHQGPPNQYDQYGTQQGQLSQQQPHQQTHGGFGGLSSSTNDYSQYYTSNDQQRHAYNQYYGSNYGPQDARSQVGGVQQDPGMGQQRAASGFGAGPNESAYSTHAQQQVGASPFHQKKQWQLVNPSVQQQLGDGGDTHKVFDEESKAFTAVIIARQRIKDTNMAQVDVLSPEVAGHLAPQLRSGTSTFVPFNDVSNRQLPDRVTAPLPKTYLSSRSNHSFQQAPSRFNEAPGSGHNTPNPLMAGGSQQQPTNQSQHSMQQQHQQPGGYGQAAGFPYGHPYYNSPYQQAYQQQFTIHHQIGGYGSSGGGGAGYPGKQGGAGMYGTGPGSYGSHSSPFDQQHAVSPANAGTFAQNMPSSMRSASGMGSSLGGSGGIDDYGRSSVQGTAQQSSAFGGGVHDPFARSSSGFGSQTGGYGGQQSMTSGSGPIEDSLKPYNEASKNGPSPALGQPGGVRPGSAANSAAGSSHSGLPPPTHQGAAGAGFGGYPGFPGQGTPGSQYGGLGGLGSHQQGQNAGAAGGYGGYGAGGAGGFGQTYGAYGSRGGWGSNYGAH